MIYRVQADLVKREGHPEDIVLVARKNSKIIFAKRFDEFEMEMAIADTMFVLDVDNIPELSKEMIIATNLHPLYSKDATLIVANSNPLNLSFFQDCGSDVGRRYLDGITESYKKFLDYRRYV